MYSASNCVDFSGNQTKSFLFDCMIWCLELREKRHAVLHLWYFVELLSSYPKVISLKLKMRRNKYDIGYSAALIGDGIPKICVLLYDTAFSATSVFYIINFVFLDSCTLLLKTVHYFPWIKRISTLICKLGSL